MFYMPQIRTTISIPSDVYEALRQESFRERRSFGDVIARRFRTSVQKAKTQSLTKDFAIFDAIASSGKSIDLGKSLRDERNRQNA